MRANLLLSFLSILITAFLLEGGLRLLDTSQPRETINQLNPNKPLNQDNHALLGELLRPSAFKEIIYELRPNLDTNFLHASVKTNAQGYRGDLCGTEKQDYEKRIIGIGDSLMFGWGIPEGQDYLAILKAKLESSTSETKWSVINTAVPGYNTRLEVETLRLKLLDCKPDVVILGFLESNDFELPHFVHDSGLPSVFNNSHLLRLLKKRFELLTKSEFIDSLSTLEKLAQKHSFQVIVYAHEMVSTETLEHFANHQFRIVQAWPILLEELQRTKSVSYKNSPLVLSPSDSHPSALGHQIAANTLAKEMEKLSFK